MAEKAITVTPLQLAREFSQILNKWLTAEELQEVVRRNRADPDQRICHSHDFCDSNQAIIDALTICGLEYDSEDESGLIDRAWAIARASDFNPASLL